MPVRIYDIAKKLGLENKEVLAKAKELSIAAAKVPSSSLDKISAEWLEEEIIKSNPAVAARLAPKPVEEKPKPAPVEEKIQIISAPPTPPAPTPEPAPAPAPIPEPVPAIEVKVESAPAVAPVVVAPPAPAPVAEAPKPVVEEPKPVVPPPAPKPVVPPTPPEPPKPQIGQLVGRIQLPARPATSRPGDRERDRGSQQRPQAGGR